MHPEEYSSFNVVDYIPINAPYNVEITGIALGGHFRFSLTLETSVLYTR